MSPLATSSPLLLNLSSDNDNKLINSSSSSSTYTDSSLSYPPSLTLSPGPKFAVFNHENSNGKGVHFLPRLQETSTSTQQIFMTTELSPLVRKLGAVHRWKRTLLDWLDADYFPRHVL